MLLSLLNDGLKYLEYIFFVISIIFFSIQIIFNQDSERIKYIVLATLFYTFFLYCALLCFKNKIDLENDFYLLSRHIVFITGVLGIVVSIYKYFCDSDLMDIAFGAICFFGIYTTSIFLTNNLIFS